MHVFLNCDRKLACKNKNPVQMYNSKTVHPQNKQHWPWRAHSWPSAAHLAACLSHSPVVEACPTPAHTASEARSEPCAVLTSVQQASSNHQTICACVGYSSCGDCDRETRSQVCNDCSIIQLVLSLDRFSTQNPLWYWGHVPRYVLCIFQATMCSAFCVCVMVTLH